MGSLLIHVDCFIQAVFRIIRSIDRVSDLGWNVLVRNMEQLSGA